jgi:hypothetical protein
MPSPSSLDISSSVDSIEDTKSSPLGCWSSMMYVNGTMNLLDVFFEFEFHESAWLGITVFQVTNKSTWFRLVDPFKPNTAWTGRGMYNDYS